EQANYGRKTYEYDPVGNRTKRTTEKDGKTETQKLTYAENSNRLIKREESNVSYDGMGNIQNNGNGLQLQYDGQGRLKAVVEGGTTQAEYRYNAIGERLVKVLNNQTVIYSYDQNGQLLEEAYYNATNQLFYTRNYAWLGTQPIAMLEQWLNDKGQSTQQQVAYIHSDHLNTPRVATNTAGQAVWQWQSDAFGVGRANEDVDGDGQKVVIALRFPGQVFDPESGLHYNYYRTYDPNIGRYIESDPIGLDGGLNTYAYVGGNPVNAYDSNGLLAQYALRGAFSVGTRIGGGINYVITAITGASLGGLIYEAVNGDSTETQDKPVDIPQESTKEECKNEDDEECSPKEGTMCYEHKPPKLNSRAHAGHLETWRVFQMQKVRGGPEKGKCFWRYLGGKIGKGVHTSQPQNMRPCSSYPGFQGRAPKGNR
ncbi:hypothetical protein H0A36_27775, partial [Endozoicomonas sp. SM1973]